MTTEERKGRKVSDLYDNKCGNEKLRHFSRLIFTFDTIFFEAIRT